MTHKQRLLTAINHEEPDRVPISAWYTPEAEKTVLRHLGVDSDATETYKATGGPLPLLMDHDFLISWVSRGTKLRKAPPRILLLLLRITHFPVDRVPNLEPGRTWPRGGV